MSSVIFWAILNAAALHSADVVPYDDAYSDGYCNAVADTGHGWRVDDIKHDKGGFTCVWSIPANEGHVESCSDVGGYAVKVNSRLVCTNRYQWEVR